MLVGGLVAACVEPPPPRTFNEFMEDRIAREGTLARCNEDARATLNDIECANARRAAATIALREERERREELELESERKLAALRDQMALRERAEREAAAAAEAAAQAAYEAFWRENSPEGVPPDPVPTFTTRLPGGRPAGDGSSAAVGGSATVPDDVVVAPSASRGDPLRVPPAGEAAPTPDGERTEAEIPRPFRQ